MNYKLIDVFAQNVTKKCGCVDILTNSACITLINHFMLIHFGIVKKVFLKQFAITRIYEPI